MLSQLDTFMKQLDTNKLQIVRAIESLNRLAISLNKQQGTIKLALDDLPRAIASVNRQRDDLVKMLKALASLSSVGTRVIRDSKTATIDSLRALAPTLTKLAEAGDALPKSLQVFLTYPFVDAVVGTNPAQARKLHMGDYTNLSIKLDLDATAGLPTIPGPPLPTDICKLDPTNTLCNPNQVLTDLQKCLKSGNLNSPACKKVGVQKLLDACSKKANKSNPVCQGLAKLPIGNKTGPLGSVLKSLTGGSAGSGGSGGSGGGSSGGCGIPLLCRAAPGGALSGSGSRRAGPAAHRLRLRSRGPVDLGDGAAMIAKRTKVQLMVFALITMVGVSFVGARYARLDRLVLDESYSVVAHFSDSGGIFTGAEVSYRGVTVGQVSKMTLTSKGVDVTLNIDKGHEDIPRDTEAVVANRSAVGEQYVDLQPKTKSKPYLADGSQIPTSNTKTPIETTKFLVDIDTTVNSVNKQSLTTVVNEFGKAFGGTGQDLGRIADTSNAFIKTANDNFDVTTALLKDSDTVLTTQIDKTSAIKSFSRDLALFSTTLATSDPDLRRVIENGSATANQLRTFLEQNKVDLGQLINNLVTTGQVTGKHIHGTEMILVVYPYVVAGGYTVVGKDPQTHVYDAHFGLVLQQDPSVCHNGYQGTDRRGPSTGATGRWPPERTVPSRRARATPAERRTRPAGRVRRTGRRWSAATTRTRSRSTTPAATRAAT